MMQPQDDVGRSLSAWREGEVDALARRFADRPVWGVVSNFSTDSLYAGMTYAEALALAKAEHDREVGREVTVVIVLSYLAAQPW